MSLADSLEKVSELSSLYEYLSLKQDPFYEECLRAIPIIKDFIRERKLIIYGGTAIDYALRLHGDKIYSDDMLSVPDLDFYSPNNVKDAQDLTDILYKAGFAESRTIVGTYVRVMRVDIGNNHFLADISFMPKVVFDVLPYIEYEGMRVIHPIYQKIDAHSAVSLPYVDPPREVVFARLKKDVHRFSLLQKYYPTVYDLSVLSALTDPKSPKYAIRKIKCAEVGLKYLLNGFAAYAVLYQCLREFAAKIAGIAKKPELAKIPAEIIASGFELVGGEFVFDSPFSYAEFLVEDSYGIIKDLKLDVKYYATNTNLFPDRAIDTAKKVIVWSHKNRLLGASEINSSHLPALDSLDSTGQKGEKNIKLVAISYMLLYMLSGAEYSTMIDKGFVPPEKLAKIDGDIYRAYYNSLLNIIEFAQDLLDKAGITAEKDEMLYQQTLIQWPFFSSLNVVGTSNKSESYQIAKKRIEMEMHLKGADKQDDMIFPINYYPSRGKAAQPFNYEASKFFIKDGRVLNHKSF